MIGGLTRENKTDTLAKIPGLGYLSLIGNIFRARHDCTSQTKRAIIVTPKTPSPR